MGVVFTVEHPKGPYVWASMHSEHANKDVCVGAGGGGAHRAYSTLAWLSMRAVIWPSPIKRSSSFSSALGGGGGCKEGGG